MIKFLKKEKEMLPQRLPSPDDIVIIPLMKTQSDILQNRLLSYYYPFGNRLRTTSARIMLPEEEVLYALPLIKFCLQEEITHIFFIERSIQHFQEIFVKLLADLNISDLKIISYKLTDPRRMSFGKQLNGMVQQFDHDHPGLTTNTLAFIDKSLHQQLESAQKFREDRSKFVEKLYYDLETEEMAQITDKEWRQYLSFTQQLYKHLCTAGYQTVTLVNIRNVREFFERQETLMLNVLSRQIILPQITEIKEALQGTFVDQFFGSAKKVLFVDDSIYSGGTKLTLVLLTKVWNIQAQFITISNHLKLTQNIVDRFITAEPRLMEDSPWLFTTQYQETNRLYLRKVYDELIKKTQISSNTETYNTFQNWEILLSGLFTNLDRTHNLTKRFKFLSKSFEYQKKKFSCFALSYWLRNGDQLSQDKLDDLIPTFITPNKPYCKNEFQKMVEKISDININSTSLLIPIRNKFSNRLRRIEDFYWLTEWKGRYSDFINTQTRRPFVWVQNYKKDILRYLSSREILRKELSNSPDFNVIATSFYQEVFGE